MKRNVLAVMAIVNGLAQANRFSWQSEVETDVGKHGQDYEHKSTEAYKAKEDKQEVSSLFNDWDDDKKVEEEKKESKSDYEKLKLLKDKLKDEEEEEEEEEEEKEKEYEHDKNKHHGHGYNKEHYDYNADPKAHKTYDHHKPAITGHHKHHGNHYDVYDYRESIIVDGKKYNYVHKPITKHHTYTKIHEPEVKPGCYGDRCDRKPCNKCGDDWAQPGCWHCKNHEGEETKTTKYAPEKTDDKYNGAKTYTYKGVTVVVPKETKAPEAPKIEKHKEQPKKEEKYEDICRKVTKGHGEHKYEETICDRVKHQKGEHPKVYVEPKKEEKYEDICRKVTKGHGEQKYEETVCDHVKKEQQPKKEEKYEDICRKVTKSHGEHKFEETICDRVKHQKEEQPKVYVEPKNENICDKIKGCPAPVPAPQPQYPKVEPVPAPAPAPAPQYPKVEPIPAPAPIPKPEEIKPVPVPAPVPVNPEQVSPEGKGFEEAPRVPLTVSKSGANYNTASIVGTIVVGIVGVMLL
ncbi:hypothetical protein FSPOR_11839 [Fusarium sporotrichioides]|uniref:Cyclin-dependent kinase inhibitor 1c n=1 Tax=Fusarium sporotrichioides TaxID=5514 RepID=A0A395RF52_FUSSP|nr:hypothetical protein FSPOR_11839 [Fusarium sporotrichioides]